LLTTVKTGIITVSSGQTNEPAKKHDVGQEKVREEQLRTIIDFSVL
jgi:hypothetical protein